LEERVRALEDYLEAAPPGTLFAASNIAVPNNSILEGVPMEASKGGGPSLRPHMLIAVLLLGGCGGVIKFEDTIAIPTALPEPPKRVELKADRIEINEKIQFELDKAEIKEASHGLLNEIVDVLKQHEDIKKVDILGHTDSDGTDEYNKDLSDRRAKAVLQYLISHGVEKQRLSAKGLGEGKPIADNETEAGKEQNRRVEFLIIERKEGAT
jgi:outer membrane protein OmpA-like peptidoglycan-associated protein